MSTATMHPNPRVRAGGPFRNGITDLVRAFYELFRTGDTTSYRQVLADSWIDIPLAPGQQQRLSRIAAQIAAFRREDRPLPARG